MIATREEWADGIASRKCWAESVCERNAALRRVDLIQHSRRDLQGLGDKPGLVWPSAFPPRFPRTNNLRFIRPASGSNRWDVIVVCAPPLYIDFRCHTTALTASQPIRNTPALVLLVDRYAHTTSQQPPWTSSSQRSPR